MVFSIGSASYKDCGYRLSPSLQIFLDNIFPIHLPHTKYLSITVHVHKPVVQYSILLRHSCVLYNVENVWQSTHLPGRLPAT